MSRDPYQTSLRNFGRNVPSADALRAACLTVAPDGTVFVSRDQCDAWAEDAAIRQRVKAAGLASGRVFLVCTVGGYVVDAWQVDHWQSGLDAPLSCECCGEPAGEGGALCPACQQHNEKE